jgi:two-component system, LytTR family, sensor kinase
MCNPLNGSIILYTPCIVQALTGKTVYWIIFFVVIGILGALFWWRERKLRRNMQARIAAQRSRASLELHAFQSQMDPHFIFNSLNAIHSYILSASTEQASTYLTRFSRLMRFTLENSSKEWIPLEEELETLELYLQLEQLRFEGQFEYEIHTAPSLDLQMLVPPFIVQPYIQNAIWYRLLQKTPEHKGMIRIEIGHNEEEVFIRVEDNGVARQSMFHHHQQRTAGTRVAAERLHWMNARYHTHAAISTGHLFDPHHNKTGTYTLFHFPNVTSTSLPEDEQIFK